MATPFFQNDLTGAWWWLSRGIREVSPPTFAPRPTEEPRRCRSIRVGCRTPFGCPDVEQARADLASPNAGGLVLPRYSRVGR